MDLNIFLERFKTENYMSLDEFFAYLKNLKVANSMKYFFARAVKKYYNYSIVRDAKAESIIPVTCLGGIRIEDNVSLLYVLFLSNIIADLKAVDKTDFINFIDRELAVASNPTFKKRLELLKKWASDEDMQELPLPLIILYGHAILFLTDSEHNKGLEFKHSLIKEMARKHYYNRPKRYYNFDPANCREFAHPYYNQLFKNYKKMADDMINALDENFINKLKGEL